MLVLTCCRVCVQPVEEQTVVVPPGKEVECLTEYMAKHFKGKDAEVICLFAHTRLSRLSGVLVNQMVFMAPLGHGEHDPGANRLAQEQNQGSSTQKCCCLQRLGLQNAGTDAALQFNKPTTDHNAGENAGAQRQN